MCGIAGVIKLSGAPASAASVAAMVGMLRHRGPDASDVLVDGAVSLGHARLSIIDLAGGGQPMSNADGTIWITFNGEIFNYVELREELANKGCQFRTHSDTEVILQLYEREGTGCVHRLNGQWAFAIWDARKKQLFLSRDRLGVRPLYYTRTGDAFLFASEIKALFTDSEVSRQLDFIGLDQVFTFWSTVPPRTIFRQVQQLPPGCSAVLRGRDLQIQRYWELDYAPESDSDAVDRYGCELMDLLLDATQIRLRSDVPVGAYLSGGLDSSLITALVRRIAPGRLKTFSVAFEDCEFDERSYQHRASQFLGTEHQQVLCSYDDIAKVFADVVWHTEQPVLRTAPAPLYLLSGLVRSAGFKVVLTGEGSDESFGGYDIFKETKIRRFCAERPESNFRPSLLKRLYPYMTEIQRQTPAYLQSFFSVSREAARDSFFSHRPRWNLTSWAKRFFSDNVRSELRGYDAVEELAAALPPNYAEWDSFTRAQYLETAYLLPGYILSSQGDRVLMAHSVEGRFPFLDHRVVEFAAKLPLPLKMKVLNEKYLLKRIAAGLIPREIIERKKQPYRAPDGKAFLGRGIAEETLQRYLRPEKIREDNVFRADAVGHLVAKFRSGRANAVRDNMAMVGILSTQILIDCYVNAFRMKSATCDPSVKSYARSS